MFYFICYILAYQNLYKWDLVVKSIVNSGKAASPLKVSSPMAPVTPQACTPSPPHLLPNPPPACAPYHPLAPAKWAYRFWAWVSPPLDVANRQETEMDPSDDDTVTARSSNHLYLKEPL